MRVVVALDKFKGSFSARQACEALADGIRRRNPKIEVELRPMADGGEGTAAILAAALGMDAMRVVVPDLLGTPIESYIYWQNSRRIALIESASVLGISRTMAREDSLWQSSTEGLGRLIQKALDLRPAEIWIAVGGTMTADAGWGLASIFGLLARDSNGTPLKPCLTNMDRIASLERSDLPDYIRKTRLLALCDVNAAALGSSVSLSSFLEQKGARPDSISRIMSLITQFRSHLATVGGSQTPPLEGAFTGAGGGLWLSISSLFPNAKAELGAYKVLRATALAAALGDAQIVICGEGRLDEQTFYGKAPQIVAEEALQQGIPVMGVFGCVQGDENQLKSRLGLTELRKLQRIDALPGSADLIKQGRLRLTEIGSEVAQWLESRREQS